MKLHSEHTEQARYGPWNVSGHAMQLETSVLPYVSE